MKRWAELKRFIRENGIDYPSFTIWTPIPGTAEGGTCYDPVVERQPNGRPDWNQFDLQHAVIPTRLPKEDTSTPACTRPPISAALRVPSRPAKRTRGGA
jgi:hypothetical protein